ncbi:MAG: phosphoribosylamine--glycine ligase, partial [Armatimonadetes bacterium]|nr:phosphoribosylamine--glycine ligase [Armatimonadota bacterium]
PPGEYETGKLIEGLDRAAQSEGCLVFHAGTREANGQFLTDGGRVLSVTATAPDLRTAADRAYAGLRQIAFDGIHYRNDIAGRALG